MSVVTHSAVIHSRGVRSESTHSKTVRRGVYCWPNLANPLSAGELLAALKKEPVARDAGRVVSGYRGVAVCFAVYIYSKIILVYIYMLYSGYKPLQPTHK